MEMGESFKCDNVLIIVCLLLIILLLWWVDKSEHLALPMDRTGRNVTNVDFVVNNVLASDSWLSKSAAVKMKMGLLRQYKSLMPVGVDPMSDARFVTLLSELKRELPRYIMSVYSIRVVDNNVRLLTDRLYDVLVKKVLA